MAARVVLVLRKLKKLMHTLVGVANHSQNRFEKPVKIAKK